MVSIKSSKTQTSKISPKDAPAGSTITKTAQKSSILRSLFSPSQFQLSLFASVIQGLDGQHLRIHDVTTGRLRCEHAITSKATINCLDWGHYGANHSDRYHKESNKKRKRSAPANGPAEHTKDVVVAFGTSVSEVLMFSPTEFKLVGSLKGEHSQGIRDFKFVDAGISGRGWSIGGDGRLVQWDLRNGKSLRSLSAPAPSVATLCPVGDSLLCASHTTYLINPDPSIQPIPFTTSSHPIHTIKKSTSQTGLANSFLTASESERGVTVFDIQSRELVGTLLPGVEAVSLALSPITPKSKSSKSIKGSTDHLLFPEQTLAAVNKDGILELFPAPFEFVQTAGQEYDSVKARVKQMTRRPGAVVRVVRSESVSPHVPLLDCAFDGNELVMAWTDGGVNLIFNRIKWRDEESGKVLLQGTNDLVKAKNGSGVTASTINGIKDMGRSHIDESHTVLASGKGIGDAGMDLSSEIIDISSGEEDSGSNDAEEEELSDKHSEPVSKNSTPSDEDITMKYADSASDASVGALDKPEPSEEANEPTFGEMIRAKAAEAIDVQGNLPSKNQTSLATVGDQTLSLPSGLSLGTILTQSLRTNDVNLLETCFHAKDLATVRATIERIDSSLAMILLERLAERLHSRPGRAGSLMVWIQWTIVAHGGYLASQPDFMKKLSSLYRVVSERANSLHSLLALKGKLDMLEAQLNLRKAMQGRSRANVLGEDEDEGVIYVEGQEDSESDDEVVGASASNAAVSTEMAKVSLRDADEDLDNIREDFEEEKDDDDLSVKMNGVVPDSEDEGSESESEGLIDDEAESTETDPEDDRSENEIDYNDRDSLSEESSDPEDSPPAKRLLKSKLANGINKKSR